jgi:hypothetical protein
VAAYLLDHDHFARVPHTVLARAKHPMFCYSQQQAQQQPQQPATPASRDAGAGGLSASFSSRAAPAASASASAADEADDSSSSELPLKLGSLQEFVRHECDTTEMGCSRFSVRDVQRIAILDIRLYNTDRHSGNILVRRPTSSSLNLRARLEEAQHELIPIDHGFCLPEALETPYFEWLHWPQVGAGAARRAVLRAAPLVAGPPGPPGPSPCGCPTWPFPLWLPRLESGCTHPGGPGTSQATPAERPTPAPRPRPASRPRRP